MKTFQVAAPGQHATRRAADLENAVAIDKGRGHRHAPVGRAQIQREVQRRLGGGHPSDAGPACAALLAVAIQLRRECALERRIPRRDAIQADARGECGLARIGQQGVEGAKQRGRRIGGRTRIRECPREVVAEQMPDGERDQRAAISGRRKQRDR